MRVLSERTEQLPDKVGFEHNFFQLIEDAHFRMSDPKDGRPMMVGSLGEQDVAISLTGIAREFGIERDSDDGRMIQLVARSLNFAKTLRPGDKIPVEVLTGEASWDPDPEHLDFTRKRMEIQLVTWHGGSQEVVESREQADERHEQCGAAANLDSAFAALGEHTGTENLTDLFNVFVAEVARFEQLREKFREVGRIKAKIDAFRKLHTDELSILNEIDPVLRLIRVPISQFAQHFRDLDEQLSDIEKVFADFDNVLGSLKKLRNALYSELSAWSGEVGRWESADPRHPESVDLVDEVREFYHFLAARYLQSVEWELVIADEDEHHDPADGPLVW